MTGELVSKFKIPAPGAYYGNLIWLAKPGVMIYPDYFNRKAPKGMHGYIANIDVQKGFAVISASKAQNITIDEAELIDICPTLCCLLDIPAPENNQGKNLLEPRNMIICSLILVCGIGGMSFKFSGFTLAGIGLAGVLGVLLNLILPDKNRTDP